MRQFTEIEKRWSNLFNTSFAADLRQAVIDDKSSNPCEDGLRSVCWKAFLLNGPLSQKAWTKKLSESRAAYASLRDHFLKFIDNPNDIHSSADPLADDDTSPWATLRQDEINREEIWQDVVRCNADNYFFREPQTQRKMLNILFIYSKLNPDIGYRQGMHELLAPLLWVVQQDAIDRKFVPNDVKNKEGIDFMLDVLDSMYVEHDAFNLFCAVMQTAKSFYETGEHKDSSAIIAQSERIHKTLLGAIDPDLAIHLEVVGIVPQIFAIRWLRLLFGREFEFKDVLKLWDVLFAENLNVEIVDMTCVAILLRLRWDLIEADYTTAITTLTKLNLPSKGDSPKNIVKDAVRLYRDRTPAAGCSIIEQRTGRRPPHTASAEDFSTRIASPPPSRAHRRLQSQDTGSPSRASGRYNTPQKQLETLFGDVSANLQKRTEGWSVQSMSKALRGAVGEVRRNMEGLQTTHSREGSLDIPRPALVEKLSFASQQAHLEKQLKMLEDRNKALAKMLDTSLESLRGWKATSHEKSAGSEDVFNTALAKIQFVSVYLGDSAIPVPAEVNSATSEKSAPQDEAGRISVDEVTPADDAQQPDESITKSQKAAAKVMLSENKKLTTSTDEDTTMAQQLQPKPSHLRPSLADSSFSFMLGEDRRGSSFVRSTPLPEERRTSDSRGKHETLWAEEKRNKDKKNATDKDKKEKNGRKNSESEDDGFTMSSLRGSRE